MTDYNKKWKEFLNKNQPNDFEYLEITPEDFKPGDLFLRTPDEKGEFFINDDALEILSISLPKDGRSNTAIINTKEGPMRISFLSLYDIARKK